jgi:hypothetical protein
MRNPIVSPRPLVCLALVGFLALGASANAWAQASASAPTLIPVSGELRGADGQPRTGPVLLVISLYEGREDAAPRWIEHQPVTLDAAGRYSVAFGGTRDEGLPTDLFAGTAATRWIGVAVEGEAEQPRVTLVSVPYAAKAASADTLSGKPLTDFVLTSTLQDDVRAVLQEDGVATSAAVVGTLNVLQKGDGAAGTKDSAVFENAGRVGIGTTTPGARLHLLDNGESEFRMQINSGPLAVMRAASWSGADFGSFSAHPVSFYTNSQERMRINAVGNVGIGTATPFSRLHILDTTESEFRLQISGGALAVVRGVVGAADIGSFSNHPLRIFTNSTERFRVTPSGDVGIGTESPSSKLHVAGAVTVGGNITVDGNIAAKYQDVAEWVDATEPLAPGTIVVIDKTATNRVAAAARAYDAGVAGAVSPQPGLTLGEPGPGKALVAQSGRVRIKVDASFGGIRPGDLLVSSPTTGHAMRADAKKVRPGTVIGKALEALPAGRGEILALLTLQ